MVSLPRFVYVSSLINSILAVNDMGQLKSIVRALRIASRQQYTVVHQFNPDVTMKLFSSQQVYQLDRLAIEQDRQPAKLLMHKAASEVWREISLRWPQARHIVVFAGPGNNGGDAFAVAMLAKQHGYNVSLFAYGDLSKQSAESAYYRQQWQAVGGETREWSGSLPACDLIVDGLLGIGLNKQLNDDWIELLQAINRCAAIRVCIDIPSGLQADTGVAMPVAVQADLTVSFIGRKIGCYLADGPDICGKRIFDDLGLSSSLTRQSEALATALDENHLVLPHPRRNNTHKVDYGHVLIVGGQPSMSGAVRLAGMAALRCGAGLVTLCVHPDNVAIAASQHPELMVASWDEFVQLASKATVLVVGPGMGKTAEAEAVLQQVSAIDKAMVIDADALETPLLSSLVAKEVVLTPHPGEAGRLLSMSAREVQQDRVAALRKLTQQWGFVSVLKGSGTLIAKDSDPIALCAAGHPGMATAGMGDVLTGMVAAYLAQGLDARDAACTAVCIHALAADDFARQHNADSLIASDIINGIGAVTRRVREKRQ